MNRETPIVRDETLIVIDRPDRKRWIIVAIGAAIALLILIVAALAMSSGEDKAATATAEGVAQAPTVSVVVPGRSEVARIVTASGQLAARRDQPIGVAGEGGLVTSVRVDAGAWVRQGQVLATIERSVQAQEGAQLAAQIAAAKADAALAQNELDRAQALVSRGFISKADLDRKQAARDSAIARVRVAQAQLGANRARIGRLDIRAPSSGLILSRNLEVGQVVGSGSQALFRLARAGEMEMRAQLAQQDLLQMKVGLPATVTPIGSNRSYSGTIWQVAPVIDPETRQGEVRVSVPYDPAIRPGGFAEVRVSAGVTNAPLLPQSAVLSDSRGNYVFIVNANNQVERRAITVGNVDDRGVTISQGLTGQEKVVQSAGPFLTAGQKVTPQRAPIR